MSITSVMDIAGSGMSAQSLRLNTLASNIANAQTVSATAEASYRARYPVFQAADNGTDLDSTFDSFFKEQLDGVRRVPGSVNVTSIYQSDAPPVQRYEPSHPLADERGYVYVSSVDVVEEMADMISASRSFEMNAEVANTAKSMMQRLISLGR